MDDLVNRELLDVRRALHLEARSGDAFLNPALKRVEVCPRLPEVDDSPTVIDRAGRVKQQPLWHRSIRIDVVMCRIELFPRNSRKLHAYTYRHSSSSLRV